MNTSIDNFTLRFLNKDDHKQFFELIDRNRTYLQDYFPKTVSVITSDDRTKKYIDEKLEEEQKKEYFSVVLVDEQQTLQGFISIKNVNWQVPKCELAYFIDEKHAGQGIMTKVLSATIDYCFETLRINKLYLTTAVDNYPSRRIVEKNGFEVEGILKKDFKRASGDLVDMVYYGLFRK